MAESFGTSPFKGGTYMAGVGPKDLLDNAHEAAERLKLRLGQVVSNQNLEYEEAIRTLQCQLKTQQGQYRTAEEQLKRSMQREKDLRDQLSNADVSTILGKARKENKELKEEVRRLSDIAEKVPEQLKRSEAEIASLKEELTAWQHEEAQRLNKHEQQIAQMRIEQRAELQKLATLKDVALQKGNQQYQELLERYSNLENTYKITLDENLELKSALSQTQSVLAASQDSASATANRIREAEAEISILQRLAAEKDCALMERQSEARACEEKCIHIDLLLVKEREEVQALRRKLNETELQLNSSANSNKLSEDNLTREIEKMASQIAELQRKNTILEAELRRAESDVQSIREQSREELRKVEAESKQVRDSLRHERDLLERTMRENSQALTEQLEQRQWSEEAALKREEALQHRLKTCEKEMLALKTSRVAEYQLRDSHEDMRLEREQLELRVKKSMDDSKRQEELHRLVVSKLERKNSELEDALTDQTRKCQAHERELREARKKMATDKYQLDNAHEHIELLSGVSKIGERTGKVKTTKMAETGLQILQDSYMRCQEMLAKHQADSFLSANPDSALGNSSHQRSALGIVLTENRVDYTLLGSPAQVLGAFEAGDEILAVNNQSVSSLSARAALCDDETHAGSATILLRKSDTSEINEVKLPRLSPALLKEKKKIRETLGELYREALEAGTNPDLTNLEIALNSISETFLASERLNLTVQLSLSEQISTLKRQMDDLHFKAQTIVAEIDSSHQQVYTLQQLTESELRDLLTSDCEETERHANASLHQHIQELEEDLKGLQEELSSAVMMRRETIEEVDHYKSKWQQIQETLRFYEDGQNRMRQTMRQLEDQLADAALDGLEYPYIVCLTLDCEYDATVRDMHAREEMESSIRDDICLTLRVPESSVQVICLHRGSVKVIIKLSGVANSSNSFSQTGKMLAIELVKGFANPSSSIHQGAYTQMVRDAEVQGPISESTAKAFKACLYDREKDSRWLQEELEHTQKSIVEIEAHYHESIELIQQENNERTKQLEERAQNLADAVTTSIHDAHQSQLARVREEFRGMQWKQKLDHELELKTIKSAFADNKNLLEELSKAKDEEITCLKASNTALEAVISKLREEIRILQENIRDANWSLRRAQEVYERTEILLIPEIRSCLTTLNNVESEMNFFYTYQMRVLAMSGVSEIITASNEMFVVLQDANNSKEMMQKDVATLKSQLEQLARYSFSNNTALDKHPAHLLDAEYSSTRSPPATSFGVNGTGRDSVASSPNPSTSRRRLLNRPASTTPPQPPLS